MGSSQPDLRALDSSTPRLASLSEGTLHRHASKVGAVCVKVPVRFCAGGDSNGRPYRDRVAEYTGLAHAITAMVSILDLIRLRRSGMPAESLHHRPLLGLWLILFVC